MSHDSVTTGSVARQNAFEATLERIRKEGRLAFAHGDLKDASPYRDHPEPHFHRSWVGGWAEAKLEAITDD